MRRGIDGRSDTAACSGCTRGMAGLGCCGRVSGSPVRLESELRVDRSGGRNRRIVIGRSLENKTWRKNMTLRGIGWAVLLLIFSIGAAAQDRKFIVNPRPADTKALPFSDAVLVGNTL